MKNNIPSTSLTKVLKSWNELPTRVFIFLPFLLVILFCIFHKKLSDEKRILIISALLISLKVFWATALSSYGVYFIPLLLIALITLAKKDYYKQISVYLILLSISFFIFFLPDRKNIKTLVKTQNGMIYVDKTYGKTSNNIIKFINKVHHSLKRY